jgi:hypothetical protein
LNQRRLGECAQLVAKSERSQSLVVHATPRERPGQQSGQDYSTQESTPAVSMHDLPAPVWGSHIPTL